MSQLPSTSGDQNAFSEFTLPCGLTLKNRLVKASMEENLANAQQLPDQALTLLSSPKNLSVNTETLPSSRFRHYFQVEKSS